ncbi:MAG: caspase family protein [Desulfobacteraceae bacterium]|nr:caspase family protein [Desulfobacteraceae bacterium]
MQNRRLPLIMAGLIIFTFLAACTTGNYLQSFEQIKKDYQKTNEIEPLIEALNHTDLRIRVLAANYLGETKDARAIGPLQEALDDRSRYVREEAKVALEKLGEIPQTRPNDSDVADASLEGIDVQKALVNTDLYSVKLGGVPRSRTSVKSLAFSPDGHFLAAGYVYGGYLIWDLKEGFLFAKQTSEGYIPSGYQRRHTPISVQYSSNSSILAVGDHRSISVRQGNGTTIWENKHAHAKPRGGSIGTSLSIARKSNILISGGIDGAVKAWAAQNGQLIKSLRDNGPAITSITISNDEETIAAGNQAGYISIWDLASFQLLRSFEADSGEINSLAFSPDKHFLVSGGNDGVIKFWNTASGALDKTLEGHSKPIKSIVFSIDGRFIATGGNDSIVKIWNAFDDHLITEFKGHSGWVESIAFSPDGKRIASGGRDGRILIWDTENKRIAAILSNFDFFDWLVVNSEGYFNTGLDASKTLIIHTNGRSYSLEPYFQLFFSPENVKRALAGETVAKANLSRLDLPPPSINILSPLDSALIEQDVVAVTISAKDRGGGVERIALYHNGRLVHGEILRGLKTKTAGSDVVTHFEVRLLAGLNTFSAVAFNREGIPSSTQTVTVTHPAAAKKVRLHALIVGINRYLNADLNLNYAVPDATAIASFFKEQRIGRLFKSVSIVTLLNEEATGPRIRDTLNDVVENTAPEDVLALYFCGHGQAIDDQWYFIPHDVLRPERDEEVRRQAISSEALAGYLKKASAQKVLLIMDSCKSGAALLAFRGYEDRRALMQLARASGVYIIAASSPNQYAAEVKELGHGVFTHTLLQGLYGRAATEAQKTVTVKRLLAYVEEQLPLISQQFKQLPQYPVVYSIGMDFPISVAE